MESDPLYSDPGKVYEMEEEEATQPANGETPNGVRAYGQEQQADTGAVDEDQPPIDNGEQRFSDKEQSSMMKTINKNHSVIENEKQL